MPRVQAASQGRRTDPASELGEVVSGVQDTDGLLPVVRDRPGRSSQE
jgi:hypothetical protein